VPQVTTAWVKPASPITGLDHLGVAAIAISLYNNLLPGINNVTDRAAYYTFYPWFLWTCENRGALKREEFIEFFRRADCLFTLIAAWHGRGNEEHLHGLRMVGRDTLVPALEEIVSGKPLKLSRFTGLEQSEARYFKNPTGGLGQYYLGTLRDLNILRGDLQQGFKFTDQCGRPIADAVCTRLDRNEFWKVIASDVIDLKTLDALVAFCPCQLKHSASERSLLIDLFFNRPGVFASELGEQRRTTLALMLDLVANLEMSAPASSPNLDLVGMFRSCVYAGALPDGKPWALPPEMETQRERWGVYQRHELLSVAVQTLFWAALDNLFNAGGVTESRATFGASFVSEFCHPVFGRSSKALFAKTVQSVQAQLPDLRDWTSDEHEINEAWNLLSLSFSNADKDTRIEAVRCATRILLAMAARESLARDPYHGLLDRPDYQTSFYPINLISFRHAVSSIWPTLTMEQWLFWLITNWGLDVHFKVALRKLRTEMKDTFRIRPADDGLRVISPVAPGFSAPRLSQAVQILSDIGIIDTDAGKKKASLTTFGREMLQVQRA